MQIKIPKHWKNSYQLIHTDSKHLQMIQKHKTSSRQVHCKQPVGIVNTTNCTTCRMHVQHAGCMWYKNYKDVTLVSVRRTQHITTFNF